MFRNLLLYYGHTQTFTYLAIQVLRSYFSFGILPLRPTHDGQATSWFLHLTAFLIPFPRFVFWLSSHYFLLRPHMFACPSHPPPLHPYADTQMWWGVCHRSSADTTRSCCSLSAWPRGDSSFLVTEAGFWEHGADCYTQVLLLIFLHSCFSCNWKSWNRVWHPVHLVVIVVYVIFLIHYFSKFKGKLFTDGPCTT